MPSDPATPRLLQHLGTQLHQILKAIERLETLLHKTSPSFHLHSKTHMTAFLIVGFCGLTFAAGVAAATFRPASPQVQPPLSPPEP